MSGDDEPLGALLVGLDELADQLFHATLAGAYHKRGFNGAAQGAALGEQDADGRFQGCKLALGDEVIEGSRVAGEGSLRCDVHDVHWLGFGLGRSPAPP